MIDVEDKLKDNLKNKKQGSRKKKISHVNLDKHGKIN